MPRQRLKLAGWTDRMPVSQYINKMVGQIGCPDRLYINKMVGQIGCPDRLDVYILVN